MNKPLRHVSVAALVLFVLLLANINYVQVVEAPHLQARPGNTRTLLESYARPRGQIVVDGKAVARSKKTNDQLKYVRVYKHGPRYAHATGYYTFLHGSAGIERAEDSLLSGKDDRLFVRRVINLFQGGKPRGATVQLTLDAGAQKAAFEGLRGHRGAAVAIDPQTGAILAMASSPSYNPNKIAGHNNKKVNKAWKRISSDPDQPLLNRALDQRYPPGSTFKLVTSAAALSSGKYTPQTQIPAPTTYTLPQTSTTLQNFGGEVCSSTGSMSLEEALTISCNTAFAKLGVKLGDDALRKQAQKFGFGDDFQVPMDTAESVFPSNPNPPQTAISAIGQYEVATTPLQMAMISAAIANSGVVMKPHLVKEVEGPDTKPIEGAQPERYGRAVSPKVADELTQMMRSVVENGTGASAQIPGTTVAGKTGTAQHGEGAAPHAWFTSFAPADNPQVAVAVIVEDGGSLGSEATGGAVAAPIARAMMQAVIHQ
ncbi:MAG: peptidoglycan D,D-transpeptidase FtsI family protein [Streptosporangiales bacterium]